MSGNVFKDDNGTSLTQRINKQEVDSTLAWLEGITGLQLRAFKLGTTGKKATSGDLDVAVNEKEVDKNKIVTILKQWAQKTHPQDNPRLWVAKSGTSVHFRTPINGKPELGYVQTDLMFGDPEWMQFTHAGSSIEDSPYKGSHRAILMSSIAKSKGLQWSPKLGLVDRESKLVVTKDPNKVAEVLLGQGSTQGDLADVETILAKIKRLPNYNALVADAKATFNKEGLVLPEATTYGSTSWFRELVDILRG
jgi:hypothetical protein